MYVKNQDTQSLILDRRKILALNPQYGGLYCVKFNAQGHEFVLSTKYILFLPKSIVFLL